VGGKSIQGFNLIRGSPAAVRLGGRIGRDVPATAEVLTSSRQGPGPRPLLRISPVLRSLSPGASGTRWDCGLCGEKLQLPGSDSGGRPCDARKPSATWLRVPPCVKQVDTFHDTVFHRQGDTLKGFLQSSFRRIPRVNRRFDLLKLGLGNGNILWLLKL